jgi:hypothetical protein
MLLVVNTRSRIVLVRLAVRLSSKDTLVSDFFFSLVRSKGVSYGSADSMAFSSSNCSDVVEFGRPVLCSIDSAFSSSAFACSSCPRNIVKEGAWNERVCAHAFAMSKLCRPVAIVETTLLARTSLHRNTLTWSPFSALARAIMSTASHDRH